MELKSLDIKNIASIESARIDFTADPLRNESVFLICGETGAGKSTILDALCLALYNQAPRLASVSQEWIGDDAIPAGKRDPEGDLSTGDPRQFLRKGAAEASVTLVFAGLDAVEYTAVWSVRRAYGNIERKIQDTVWTISWGDGETLHKRNEVKAKVEQVTGMTFEQYCRTSMLAQGEFARFLKSSETDKADILEKLTRTDIYARIGVRIAQKAKEYKEAYLLQQEKISGIILLDENGRKELQAGLSSKEAALSSLAAERESLSGKLVWLRTLHSLESKVEESRLESESAKKTVSSDSFLRDVNLCRDWDATSDRRAALSRKKELESELQRLSEESSENRRKFVSLSADLTDRKSELEKLVSRHTALGERLASLRQSDSMYVSFKAIKDRLGSVISSRKTAEDLHGRLKLVMEDLEKGKAEYSSMTDSSEKMRLERESVRKNLGELDSKIALMDKSAKTEAKDSLDNRLLLVKEAGMSVKALHKAGERRSKEAELLASYIKSHKEAVVAADDAQAAFTLADRLYTEATALVDRMKDSVDSWARVARSRLHMGDICPLCGQKIESLASDEEFEGILAPLVDDLERKSAGRKAAETARNDSAASVSAWEKTIKTQKEALERAENEYSADMTDAVSRCRLISVSPDSDDALERLREHYRILSVEREALVRTLDEIAAAEKSARSLQEDINRLDSNIEAKEKAAKEILETISSLEREAASLQAGADSAERNAEVSLSLVDRDIVMEGWKERFHADPEGFISSLEAESEQYSRDKEELSSLAGSIEKKKDILRNMEKYMHSILEIFPEWSDAAGLRYTKSLAGWDDIRQEWVELYSGTCSVRDRLKAAEDDLRHVESSLDEFFAGNTVSRERLEELYGISPEEISSIKEKVASGMSAVENTGSVLRQREEDLKKHRQSAPEMGPDDTAERLETCLMQTENSLNALNQDIGSMKQRLSADEENVRLAGREKDKAEQLRLRSGKWDRLYGIFGDMEGKKFKKIAQGYVMTELVGNANVYLDRLSGRYVLDSRPGSLTLTVRDLYQGGAVRSVNTLSGGETFLVSLALALGLSSLSKGSLDVNILFIDEGFGTLSSDYLDAVMEALENLHQAGGRKVGIISHVESLRERIPVQIRVSRQGSSSSIVSVVTA